MAVTKTILKNTHQEAVIKVEGTADAAVIDLDVDLVNSGQSASTVNDQVVNIVGMVWTGATGGVITITRNAVVIATLLAEASGNIDFNGQDMIPDTIENDQDITVTISGAQAELWLRVRKVSGYDNYIEPATYGAYDDPTRVGASTTMSGSPDKV